MRLLSTDEMLLFNFSTGERGSDSGFVQHHVPPLLCMYFYQAGG